MRKKVRDVKREKWLARQRRVARKLAASDRHRLTVFRTARHIYAQLDDPRTGQTLGRVSSRSPKVRGDLGPGGKVEAAKVVGAAVAELARSRGIESVVFNRNGFLYHGRVRALAEAARKAGLEF